MHRHDLYNWEHSFKRMAFDSYPIEGVLPQSANIRVDGILQSVGARAYPRN